VRGRAFALALCTALALGCDGIDFETSGEIAGAAKPAAVVRASEKARRYAHAAVAHRESAGQILFGDLHVHSSYSWDGFLFTLPMVGGEGAHPPADACDFARYCADLDFFALTDHAESLTPDQWSRTKESLRQCNATAGDPADPDLVAFTGFEWSQSGLTPETHWGHRCVIFPDDDEASLPPRPIGFQDNNDRYADLTGVLGLLQWIQPQDYGRYRDAKAHAEMLAATPTCSPAIDTRELPADCREVAATPAELHARLDQHGLEALSIPHGTAWGVYTPATTDIRKHLAPGHYRPDREPLIEIMSGHGNSEEFREIAAIEVPEGGGEHVCPEPTADYLPCCWQAGEIMRQRCGDLAADECEQRVTEARQLAAQAWVKPFLVFPDTEPADWLDCDQCRDCFKPSFNFRPRESVQYAMSLAHESEQDDRGRPLRFRYGFVASSDNHTARPGTGYKQVERGMMTDAVGQPSPVLTALMRFANRMDDPTVPQVPDEAGVGVSGNDLRATSFLFPGGLAAVHAPSRDRRAIWDALHRREAYGTSGPRILLWFDLLNGPGGPAPMGSEVTMSRVPRFEVRAVGDFVQQPGCPAWAGEGLAPERLGRLCRDECYHPGDARHPIIAVEVVRIRPQRTADEAVAPLIEDPWRRFDCEPDPKGCIVRFRDPDFAADERDALYYARALQELTPAINGDPLEPVRDGDGRTLGTTPCLGPGSDDGCPAEVQERAWSSPIFVNAP
jgi:hypothetical protein